MKKLFTIILIALSAYANAQIGIGTTTPNSTLDVRGALSLNLRVFTGTTTPISSTDNTVIFTGTAASTATLPDATTCAGRMYRIKNASITSPTPLLTIATTSSQTIDGLATWVLDEGYGSIAIVSNGTNWLISSQSVPKSSGSAWVQGGNSVSAVKNLGTVTNFDLPFITNNTERMRLTATGRLGIGTNSPASDLTLYQGSGASTSQGFRFTGNSIGGTNTGSGFAMTLGYNTVNNKQLWFGDADYLGNSAATFLRIESVSGLTSFDGIAGDGSIRKPVRIGVGGDPNSAIILGGDASSTIPSSFIWANGNMAIGSSYISTAAPTNGLIVQGNTGIGASTFNGTYPERLIVDAGTPGVAGRYQNVIVGKGNTNSYAQLNIQNINAGLNASSDVVATADNGSETTNYVDMGINSSVNTSGVMGTANDAYLYNIGQHFFIGTGTVAKSIIFLTGGTDSATNEKMRIDGNGNVGIGTVPAEKLDVAGNISADNSIYVDAGNTNTGTKTPGLFFGGGGSGEVIASKRTTGTNQYGLSFFTGSNLRLLIGSAGDVTPGANNAYTLGSTTFRWSTIYAQNALNTSSDRRLKTNIFNLQYGLKQVMAMQPVSYNWKTTPDTDKKLGLIAQDVRKIVPEVVKGDEAKETLSIAYSDLIPVLINAIKEQQKQIEDLKKKVAALERK